jgi:hypothetical protein
MFSIIRAPRIQSSDCAGSSSLTIFTVLFTDGRSLGQVLTILLYCRQTAAFFCLHFVVKRMLNNIVTNNHASSRLVNLRLLGLGQFFLSAQHQHQHGVPVPKKKLTAVQEQPGPRRPAHTQLHADMLHLAGRTFPCGSLWWMWIQRFAGPRHLPRRKNKGRREILGKANSGIGECQCVPCDGDGDARLILRALASGPPPTGFTCS